MNWYLRSELVLLSIRGGLRRGGDPYHPRLYNPRSTMHPYDSIFRLLKLYLVLSLLRLLSVQPHTFVLQKKASGELWKLSIHSTHHIPDISIWTPPVWQECPTSNLVSIYTVFFTGNYLEYGSPAPTKHPERHPTYSNLRRRKKNPHRRRASQSQLNSRAPSAL